MLTHISCPKIYKYKNLVSDRPFQPSLSIGIVINEHIFNLAHSIGIMQKEHIESYSHLMTLLVVSIIHKCIILLQKCVNLKLE